MLESIAAVRRPPTSYSYTSKKTFDFLRCLSQSGTFWHPPRTYFFSLLGGTTIFTEGDPPYFAHCCGMDFMGPIEIKQGRNLLKRCCCVFTCLGSRVTHLEMVCSLTTDYFLMVLRRFFSVREYGTRTIYSDNATNFVGANAELKRGIQQLNNCKITSNLSLCGIEWKYAPSLASHQGGIYEAIIRFVRKIPESMMDDQKLRSLIDAKFETLLKEIDCILNNRPLTQVGSDFEELQALTPSMLLTESVSPGLPTDVFLASDSLRSCWRACQYQADEFWKRWRLEYLPSYNVVKNGCVLSANTRLVISFSY